jgi:hypothetical protein
MAPKVVLGTFAEPIYAKTSEKLVHCHVPINTLLEASCGKGLGGERNKSSPSPPTLFPNWSVDITLKDDVTGILLLDVSLHVNKVLSASRFQIQKFRETSQSGLAKNNSKYPLLELEFDPVIWARVRYSSGISYKCLGPGFPALSDKKWSFRW